MNTAVLPLDTVAEERGLAVSRSIRCWDVEDPAKL